MAEGASGEAEVNRWVVLVAVMLGTFLSILDTTIMTVAFPHIMTAFGSDVEGTRWVTTAFMISAAVSMPTSSWLGRRLGYGPTYLAALMLFTAGAAFSASAWSLDSLIISRIVQGLAAGVIQPTSIAILTRTFPPEIRGRVFGIWSIGVMVAPTLGPTVGGFVIEWFNWRGIFTMSLIAGLPAILMAAAVLSREREEAQPFDWKGYLALATFLVVGLLTISFGENEGWTSQIILLGGAITLVSMLLFLALEWDEPYPIVPLRLFRLPDFTLAMFLTVYRSLGLFGSVFLLPIFLQQIQGWGSASIGLMMMPGAVVMTLCSPIAGILTDRFGGRWPTIIGVVLISYSQYLYRDLDAASGVWAILWPQLPRGFGMAMIMTPVITTGMNAVPQDDAGHASWMLNLSQRGGGAFAISMLSSLLQRETTLQTFRLGGSPLINTPPSAEIVREGMRAGFSAAEASSVATAIFGRQIRRAAGALAFQKLYLLTGLVTVTAVIPAFFLSTSAERAAVAARAAANTARA